MNICTDSTGVPSVRWQPARSLHSWASPTLHCELFMITPGSSASRSVSSSTGHRWHPLTREQPLRLKKKVRGLNGIWHHVQAGYVDRTYCQPNPAGGNGRFKPPLDVFLARSLGGTGFAGHL